MKKIFALAARILTGGTVAAGIAAAALSGSATAAPTAAPAAPHSTVSVVFNSSAAPSSQSTEASPATYTSNTGETFKIQPVWWKYKCVPSNRGGMVICYENEYPGAQPPPDWNTNNYVPYLREPWNPQSRAVVTDGGTVRTFPGRHH